MTVMRSMECIIIGVVMLSGVHRVVISCWAVRAGALTKNTFLSGLDMKENKPTLRYKAKEIIEKQLTSLENMVAFYRHYDFLEINGRHTSEATRLIKELRLVVGRMK